MPENALEHNKKKPGLNADRPSNNSALGLMTRRSLLRFQLGVFGFFLSSRL